MREQDGETEVRYADRWADCPKQGEKLRPLAVVIGGGITGLSAAHELAERGFNVMVVEKDVQRGDGDVDVGGVAKSQWFKPDERAGREGLTRAVPRIAPLRVATPLGDTWPDAIWSWIRRAETSSYGIEVTVNEPSQRAMWEEMFLMRFLQPAIAAAEASQLPTPEMPVINFRVDPLASIGALFHGLHAPGEHGFRFFPAFYRNLFDTMRRTPLGGGRGALPLGEADPYRTVFDNLVPMNDLYVGLGDGEPPFRIPRSKPGSLDELFRMADEMYRRLDFEPRDALRFQYELLRWMTSCGERRRRWSKPSKDGKYPNDGSWWGHIRAKENFSPGFQEQMRATSMALVGMRENEIDARTYGNICVQLLLDQLGHGERVDYSLNGPTSEAWFDHWQGYLQDIGVAFVKGTVHEFVVEGATLTPDWGESGLELRPPKVYDPTMLEGQRYWIERLATCAPDHWVCALPLPELFVLDRPEFSDPDAGPFRNIHVWKEQSAGEKCPYTPHNLVDEMPLRTMAGVQYFSKDHLHIERGHFYFPRSEWWLSALVQTNHWRSRTNEYRGVLSVDVSGFGQPGGPAVGGKPAWAVTKEQLADEVLRQVTKGRGGGKRLREMPPVTLKHVDNYLEYDETTGHLTKNGAPYLINLPAQWEERPGKLRERGERNYGLDDIEYPTGFGNWVMAGPHCKTWTRLATMEAANESARHAVNAILTARNTEDGDVDDSRERRVRGRRWAPVPVENLEDNEIDDLAVFREVDEKLCKDGVPHLFEVLKLDELLEEILGTTNEGRVASAFEDVIRDRLGLGAGAKHTGGLAGPMTQIFARMQKAITSWGDRNKRS